MGTFGVASFILHEVMFYTLFNIILNAHIKLVHNYMKIKKGTSSFGLNKLKTFKFPIKYLDLILLVFLESYLWKLYIF